MAYLALVLVCIIWGSTYFAIRVALETTPPLIIVATRYAGSGVILLLAALLARRQFPKGRELAIAAISGVMILAVGNGTLVTSELFIPSGTTALIVALFPFWLTIMEMLLPGGERISSSAALGMAIAFVGAALLATRSGIALTEGGEWKGFVILQFGMASWSFASVYQRKRLRTGGTLVASAIQQLCGSCACLPLIAPAVGKWHPDHRAVLAILYLMIFASVIGYSCYLIALKHLSVGIVALYPYANAAVALVIGAFAYKEPIGWKGCLSMALIGLGVIVSAYKRVFQKQPARSAQLHQGADEQSARCRGLESSKVNALNDE